MVATQQVALEVTALQVALVVAAWYAALGFVSQQVALAVAVLVAPLLLPTEIDAFVAAADSATIPPSFQLSTALIALSAGICTVLDAIKL